MPQIFAGGAVSDVDEDAQPAFSPPPVSAPGIGDADGPSIEELEAQMGGEVAARDAASSRATAPRRKESVDEDDSAGAGKAGPLPELDALVARLPSEVRETLDELFRARFVAVKKLPKKVFAPASAKAPPAAS